MTTGTPVVSAVPAAQIEPLIPVAVEHTFKFGANGHDQLVLMPPVVVNGGVDGAQDGGVLGTQLVTE